MAFFDNMKGKISQTSSSTVQKAKDLSEITRLNRLISESENQISELYGRIGYEVYRAYHENPLPEVSELINQVTETHKNIVTYREQIQTINNANTCPQCHSKISKGMAFCSGCGYKLTITETTESPVQSAFCSNCGASISADSMFCASCGQKLGQSQLLLRKCALRFFQCAFP